jgi:c-di-GMP-binding flagellar brake protein YcgR
MGKRELEKVREKRTSRRIRSLNLTSYTPRKADKQEYIVSIGRTLDVSEGGVKVETHRKLADGTELEMDIAIEDRIITAKGEVVHTEELENSLFGTGIRFTSISEEDRRSLR